MKKYIYSLVWQRANDYNPSGIKLVHGIANVATEEEALGGAIIGEFPGAGYTLVAWKVTELAEEPEL